MPPSQQPTPIAFSARTFRRRRADASCVSPPARVRQRWPPPRSGIIFDELKIDPAHLSGLATTRHGYGLPTRRIEIIEAGHPVPDEAGLRGADRSLALAQSAGDAIWALGTLTGGGSANWIAPVEGVSFAQKQQVNKSLLRSGAPISEVNTVRKHLSRIKGGRLARAGMPPRS